MERKLRALKIKKCEKPDGERSLWDNKTTAEKLSEFTLPRQRCWGIFTPDAANRSEEQAPLEGCAQEVLKY